MSVRRAIAEAETAAMNVAEFCRCHLERVQNAHTPSVRVRRGMTRPVASETAGTPSGSAPFASTRADDASTVDHLELAAFGPAGPDGDEPADAFKNP